MSALRVSPGLTLVEVMIATAVVSLLALSVGGAARSILVTGVAAERGGRVTELGLSLLDEVACLPFRDPDTGGTTLGPEAGEWVAFGNRAAFDDVDDYLAWNSGLPLQQKDGTPINLPGYTRTVAVGYVNPANFALASFTPTTCKQITVHVWRNGTLLKSFTTVRIEGGRHVDQ